MQNYNVPSAERDAETIIMQSRMRHLMRLRICATYGCSSYGDHNEKRCNSLSDSDCRPVQSSDMTIIVPVGLVATCMDRQKEERRSVRPGWMRSIHAGISINKPINPPCTYVHATNIVMQFHQPECDHFPTCVYAHMDAQAGSIDRSPGIRKKHRKRHNYNKRRHR